MQSARVGFTAVSLMHIFLPLQNYVAYDRHLIKGPHAKRSMIQYIN